MKTVISLLVSLFYLSALATTALARTFVVPHILEKRGSVTEQGHTFDTTIYATYVGGLLAGSASTATVSIYLFSDTGTPMLSKTGEEVANPTTFVLDTRSRKIALKLEDQIKDQGGFATKTMSGFAAIVVDGDADNVNLEAVVVNSGRSKNDLSIFGFTPQPAGN